MMDNELIMYMRQHPKWYIILSRDPYRIKELEEYYKRDTNKTLEARLDQISTVLDMIELLL